MGHTTVDDWLVEDYAFCLLSPSTCCASAFAWHSRSSRATASALPVLVPRPPAFALSGRRDVHPHVRPRAHVLGHLFTVRACLHQPQLQHQLQVLHRHGHRHREEHGRDISGTCVRTGQRYTSGKAVEPGWVCSDKGLPYIWDQMKKMMATAKFSSAATPKFRGDFVV